MAKIWFITGTSTGLGREWAGAALERGDCVAGTSRSVSRLGDLAKQYGERLLPLELDVTDRPAVFDAVASAHAHFGRLDVMVNNAGYGQYGCVEELTEAEARAQLETNFFGALWGTQAALPFLREQGAGRIIQVSSVGGLTAAGSLGVYHASKWALEGMSEALAQEVAEFGIGVTIVEPTGYATAAEGAAGRSAPHPAYARHQQRRVEVRAAVAAREGDATATRDAILTIVDADPAPLRVLLGAGALQTVEASLTARLENLREWEPVSIAAHGKAPG